MAETKTFNQWTKDDLRIEFDLRRVEQCNGWDAWLARLDDAPITLSELELGVLEMLRQRARIYLDDWNEWELREQFIGSIVSLADLNDADKFFSTFAERQLKATVKGIRDEEEIELYGKVDWMVAKGMATPSSPYFFIHEYKQEESGTKSNRGQLLATMLAAQELNNDCQPIYGIYVLGRNWFFTVLQGRQYCITDAYLSTKEADLHDILRLLKAQKIMIGERVMI
ncbi:MAG: hypothetical protein AAF639_30020 [Chloroflexota bacterium]